MSIYQLANARQHAHMDIACLQRRHDLASADAQRARDRQDDLVHPAPPAQGREAAELKVLIAAPRSEEHTSELQSLMRISYAVFCLKKQKKIRLQKYHKHPALYTPPISYYKQ